MDYTDWQTLKFKKRNQNQLAEHFRISGKIFGDYVKMGMDRKNPYIISHWIFVNSTHLRIKEKTFKVLNKWKNKWPIPQVQNVNKPDNDDWINSLDIAGVAEAKAREELRKIVAQQKKIDIENQIKLKTLVSRSDVADTITSCLSKLTQGLLKLSTTLPNQLVGKENSEMIKIIELEIRVLLDQLAEDLRKV